MTCVPIVRHSIQRAHTTKRVEPHNVKHAIDWRDRFPLAVARTRWYGLTSKWHKPRRYLCPAPGRTKKCGLENDSSLMSTCARLRIRRHLVGLQLFAARLAARQ